MITLQAQKKDVFHGTAKIKPTKPFFALAKYEKFIVTYKVYEEEETSENHSRNKRANRGAVSPSTVGEEASSHPLKKIKVIKPKPILEDSNHQPEEAKKTHHMMIDLA